MAIRPHFYGVNLNNFKKLFVGGNTISQANVLYSNYRDDRYTPTDDSFEQEYEEGIKKMIEEAVVKGGNAVINLEYEHPDVMFRILVEQPETIYTDSDDWRNYQGIFFENILEKVNNEIKLLINYFIYGRKLFSEGNTDSEFPYAYLTLDEMKIILEDMIKNPESYSDPENFDKDFKKWIMSFVNQGKDMFYWQS